MLNLFNNKNIRNRVMQVVELRIAEAQKKHDAELELLIKDRDNQILEAHEQFNADKQDLEEEIVKEVLGKVL